MKSVNHNGQGKKRSFEVVFKEVVCEVSCISSKFLFREIVCRRALAVLIHNSIELL